MKRPCTRTGLKAVAGLSLAALFAAAGCGDDSPPRVDAGIDGGQGSAVLSVSPPMATFGPTVTDMKSVVVPFMVTNQGTAASGPLVVSIVGPDQTEFEIQSNGCTSALAASSTCAVNVVFAPKTAAAMKTAQLRIAGRTASETTAANLSGIAVAPSALSITPASQPFGSVVTGQSSQAVEFTVVNTGGLDSGVPMIAIGGNDPGEYTIIANTCTAALPATTGSCKVSVKFNPTSPGAKVASLTATANPGGMGTASLTGTGLKPFSLAITPSVQAFEATPVGSMTAGIQFTVQNSGEAAATGLTVTVGGANPDQFKIDGNDCGDMVAAGGSCKVTVRFAPTKAGALQGSLSVSSGTSGLVTAALSGTGQAAAALTASTTSLNFGTVVVNNPSASVVVTFTNSGGLPTGALTAAVEGTDANQFQVASNGCNGATVAAAGTCVVELKFAPTTQGAKAANLKVTGTPGGTVNVALSGTSNPPGQITITPTVSDFQNVVLGAMSAATTFTVKNEGGSATGVLATAIAGANPADFPIVAASNSCAGNTLAVNATCTISVVFAPQTSGAKAASLTVSGNPGGTATASLSGTGRRVANIEVLPTQQDFGSVVQGQSSPDVTITVTNTGEQTTSMIVPTLVGANADQFQVASTTCTTLAGGASCDVVVRFAPLLTSPVGPKNAQLSVTATTGGNKTVPLAGVAVSTTSVKLAPSTQGFGNIVVDQVSAVQSFTVTNDAVPNTGAITVALGGANKAEFTIVSNNCSALIQGTSCTVTVNFTPASGGAKSASLDVTTASANMLSASLTGNAIEKLMIGDADEPLPAVPGNRVAVSHDYGTTFPAKAQDVPTRTFTVRCSSGSPARTCGPLVTANTDAANFIVRSDACNGVTLTDGATCDIVVDFEPGTSGAKMSTLSVTGGAKEAVSAALTGAAVPPLQAVFQDCDQPGTAGRVFADTLVGKTDCAILHVTYASGGSTIPNTSPLNVVLAGANVDQFAVTNSTCSGASLAPDATCDVTIAFVPTSLGEKTGSITVSGATVGETVSKSFSGVAVVGQALSISAPSHDFGGVATGGTSAEFAFTITNTGGLPTGVLAVTPDTGANNFVITNTCAGNMLGVGASCTVTTRFAPPAGSGPGARAGSFTVSDGTATTGATLSGTALSIVSIAPSGTFDFGAHPKNTNTAQGFVLTNGSGSALSLAPASISGVDASQFTITGSDCPVSLPNAASCTVTVTYNTGAGSTAATHSAQLNVTGVNVNLTVALTGTRQAEANLDFSATPISTDFGSVWLGTTGTSKTFTVVNTGGLTSGPIVVTLPTDYAQVGGTCQAGVTDLAPGAPCTLIIALKPAVGGSAGNRNGNLEVRPASNDAALGTGALALTGVAVAPTQILVTPTAADFGTIVQGQNSDTVVFTVSNPNGGTSTTTLAWATADPQFQITANTCGAGGASGTSGSGVLATNTTCTVTVRFSPTAAPGTNVASELVVSDGANSARAALSGRISQVATLAFVGSANPLTTSFGPIVLGTSAMRTVTVINTGDQATSALTVTLGGPVSGDNGSAHYMLSANTCAGATLTPGMTCSYVVSFVPTTVGEKLASVAVSATTGGALRQDLSGTALAQASITISPDPNTPVVLATGAVTQTNAAASDFTVTNNAGSVPTGPFTITVSDPNFAFTTTCPTAPGTSLAGGATCTVSVRMQPVAVGTFTGTVNVSANPGGMADAAITGQGVSALSATGGAVGNVNVGASGETTVTVTNNANAVATTVLSTSLSANQFSEFAIKSDGCAGTSLAPGGTCSIVVGLVPNSAGAKAATLRVYQNGAVSDVTVNLTGTGTTP